MASYQECNTSKVVKAAYRIPGESKAVQEALKITGEVVGGAFDVVSPFDCRALLPIKYKKGGNRGSENPGQFIKQCLYIGSQPSVGRP